jgi:uncharacterized protein (DUF2236 family)
VVLGWSRAILLQLAHPLVAAGVADHSAFRSGGISAVVRLHHTIRAMLALTFGDERARTTALEAIRAIHRRVHGRLPAAAGAFPAGTPYSAEDPRLVLWVHATLLESIPMIYERVNRRLTVGERDAYCEEAAGIAVELGARDDDVPRSWDALTDYLRRMYTSGEITVSAQAREVASAVLAPPLGRVAAPMAWMNRIVTLGLLPQEIRRQYGLDWTNGDRAACERVLRTLARGRRFLPRRAALWPEARRVGM